MWEVFIEQSLVVRGWQRAGSWSAVFGTGLGGSDFPTPSTIYAADPTARTGDEPSQRPFETISPLAARLGLTPETKYALGQETDLANAIVNQSGVVLVAWEHEAIVKALLPAITNGQTLSGMPSKWDGTRFDVVLSLDRSSPVDSWSFRQLFPCLLSGDSATPLGFGVELSDPVPNGRK
jgi:hypothetical protein